MNDTAARRDRGARELVRVRVGGERYGVELLRLKGVDRLQSLELPDRTLAFVEGFALLGGQFVPIVDLGSRLGLGKCPPDDGSRVLLADVGLLRVGFRVDSVEDVVTVVPDQVRPLRALPPGTRPECVRGIVEVEGRLLVLLDLGRLLEPEELGRLEGPRGSPERRPPWEAAPSAQRTSAG